MAHEIESPMAGVVKELMVATGDTVSEGQEVVLLEAMKMEIPVESTGSGAVSEIRVAAGDLIEEGQVLLVLG